MLNTLKMYTVYCRPDDFPDKYVVREWIIEKGVAKSGELVTIAKNYEEVCSFRAEHFGGVYVMPRQKGDAPAIVEVWL
jgi:hypothetical protein